MNVALWYTPGKDPGTLAIASGSFETQVAFIGGKVTMYAEWADPCACDGQTFLEFMLRKNTQPRDTVGKDDKVRLFPFRSIVVVMGGFEQDPKEMYVKSNDNGVYSQLGQTLYQMMAYDVRLYHEKKVESGGPNNAKADIMRAVSEQFVKEIAIVGFSWGGGSTFVLANSLKGEAIMSEPFNAKISFTGYIDAIVDSTTLELADSETKWPPGSKYHVNYFQQNTFRSLGVIGAATDPDPVTGLQAENINVTSWLHYNPRTRKNETMVHTSIDDDEEVLKGMREKLTSKLPKR